MDASFKVETAAMIKQTRIILVKVFLGARVLPREFDLAQGAKSSPGNVRQKKARS